MPASRRVRTILLLGAVLALVGFLCGCGSPESRRASHIARGQKYLADGKLEKARVEFSDALQIAPQDGEARYLSGRVLEQLGDFRGAAALYQGTIDVAPGHGAARAHLARLYVFAGNAAKALELLEPALASHPDAPDLLTARAAARAALKDDVGALADAGHALQLAPSSEDTVAVLSGLYVREGQPQQAAGLLQAALKRTPDSIELHQILARVHLASGERRLAEEQLIELVGLRPTELRPRLQLAAFYTGTGRLDDAERTLKSAMVALPKDHEARLAYIDFLAAQRSPGPAEAALRDLIAHDRSDHELQLKLGELQQRGGKSQDAMATYRAVVAADPAGPRGAAARDRIAALDLLAGRYADARLLLEEALQRNPRDSDALTLRANLSLQEGDPVAAIADLRAVLRDEPSSISVLRALARAHRANQAPALAEESLRTALDAAPRDIGVRADLAELLIATQRADEAAALLEEAVKAAPGASGLAARVALVRAYLAKPDLAAAYAAATDLTTFQPEQPAGWYLAGLVAEQQKRTDDARRAFEHSLQLQPSATDALAALARLEFGRGQHAQAIAVVHERLERAPGDAAAHNLLGELYLADGRPAKAASALQEAVRLAPKWWLPYRNLARARLAELDAARALAACEAGAKATQEPLLVMYLAELYEQQGRHEDAIRQYEALHQRNPRLEAAANNLAMLLVTYHSDPASLDRARELSAPFVNSEVGALLDTHGWVMFKRGEVSAALSELQRASAEAPDSKVILYHLGIAQLKAGQTVKARASLEAALSGGAAFTGTDEARLALAQLKAGIG